MVLKSLTLSRSAPGRQAFVLEVARSIVSSPPKPGAAVPDPHGRMPFHHPSLTGLDNLNAELPQQVVDMEKMAKFAVDVGLDRVLRWKPRLVSLRAHAFCIGPSRD
jgi:large subunit ribosomal protein L15